MEENFKNKDIMSNFNHNLDEFYSTQKQIIMHLKDTDSKEFRKVVEKVSAKYQKEENVHISRTLQISYLAAATIAIIIGSLFVFKMLSYNTMSVSKTLAFQYNTPYNPELNRLKESEIREAIKLYENNKYKDAIAILQNTKLKDDCIDFFIGVSYMNLKNYNSALNYLINILSSTDNEYYVQAKWYISLCWLALDKVDNARIHLTWLKYNDSFYGEKASEILQKLSANK